MSKKDPGVEVSVRPIDHTARGTAARIVAIQRTAYAIEAELIGFDGIPPLHESVEDVVALQGLQWRAAFEGETIIGIIAWSIDGDAIEIDRLAVDPSWSLRGHGRRLVRSVPDAAVVYVSTGSLNQPAIALYESEGFAQIGTIEIEPGVFITKLRRRG